jgi:hypothetical protein
MSDGVKRAQDRRNLLERIAARIPGIKGYLDRELRREVDKMQRDWLAEQVDRARGRLNGKVREWSRGGGLAGLDLAATSEKALDRFANRIRHADYGYTGFFDAVKIRELELDQLYEFDLALMDIVEGLAAQVEALPATGAEPALRELLEAVTEADRRFDDRARIFEDVTQKGGR